MKGRAMDWQPIETAPNDGTEVLVWREDAGIFLARWTSPEAFCTCAEIESLGESAFKDDWFAADFVQGSRLDGDLVPTHWMPLPKPPVVTPEDKARWDHENGRGVNI